MAKDELEGIADELEDSDTLDETPSLSAELEDFATEVELEMASELEEISEFEEDEGRAEEIEDSAVPEEDAITSEELEAGSEIDEELEDSIELLDFSNKSSISNTFHLPSEQMSVTCSLSRNALSPSRLSVQFFRESLVSTDSPRVIQRSA